MWGIDDLASSFVADVKDFSDEVLQALALGTLPASLGIRPADTTAREAAERAAVTVLTVRHAARKNKD